MKILIYVVGMLIFFGCDSELSGGVPPTGIGLYEVNGVQFRMREIPAGDGIASFLLAETEATQQLYEAVMGSNPGQSHQFLLQTSPHALGADDPRWLYRYRGGLGRD